MELISSRIKLLQEHEYQAQEAKDYPACMYLYGAIIYFQKFLRELKELDEDDKK